jgi:hypothetical protein
LTDQIAIFHEKKNKKFSNEDDEFVKKKNPRKYLMISNETERQGDAR